MEHHQVAELPDQFFFTSLDLHLHLLADSLRHDILHLLFDTTIFFPSSVEGTRPGFLSLGRCLLRQLFIRPQAGRSRLTRPQVNASLFDEFIYVNYVRPTDPIPAPRSASTPSRSTPI